MSDPSRVRMTGPLSPFAQGFAAELARHGYRRSAVANQLRLIAHLSRWLQAQHLDARHLTSPVLDKFLATRRAKGYVLWLSARALTPFLDHLRKHGFSQPPLSKPERSPSEELLECYRTYLLDVRGIADNTARGYVDTVRPFVVGRARDGQLDWAGLTGADVVAFVHSASRHLASSSTQLLGSALRSLLTYLHIEGMLHRSLSAAIPSVAGSKHAGLPRALELGEVERLLAACDRRTRTGRRDFAILMLLVRLGLRAGEVCTLSLDDLNWRAGELIVRGKGIRVERLPLPVDVGAALAAYLRRGRPTTAQGRTVFVRVHAPHRALTAAGITGVVRTAASRAGVRAVTAHRLRHTVATHLVRAGASLPEISQVLRHRRLLTTAIYAKVDREGLRQLARRWPGGAP